MLRKTINDARMFTLLFGGINLLLLIIHFNYVTASTFFFILAFSLFLIILDNKQDIDILPRYSKDDLKNISIGIIGIFALYFGGFLLLDPIRTILGASPYLNVTFNILKTASLSSLGIFQQALADKINGIWYSIIAPGTIEVLAFQKGIFEPMVDNFVKSWNFSPKMIIVIVFKAFLFAVAHLFAKGVGSIDGYIWVFLLDIIATVLVIKTKNLLPAFVLHIGNNLVALTT